MTLTEFIGMRSLKGLTREQVEEEWEGMIAVGNEGESHGRSTQMWIAENKKRFRDRTVYEDQGWDAGGKMKKGSNPDECETMRQWAVDSVCFGSKFMVKVSKDAQASSDALDVKLLQQKTRPRRSMWLWQPQQFTRRSRRTSNS